MEKPSEIAKSIFLFLKSDEAMVMRIEFLVVVTAVLFLLMSILDMFRHRSRHNLIKYFLLILDGISDSTLIYTIGLMQSVPSLKKDLFPVWALMLVNLRSSVCFISAYGIPDQQNRRFTEVARVMALIGVAFLNTTFNSRFKHPIWALWAMQVVRCGYLLRVYRLATRSYLHGWSSPLLTAYMGTPDGVAANGDTATMRGYKYLVSGDQKQTVEVKPPEYKFTLFVPEHRRKMLVTLDKVWQQDASDTSSTDILTPQMKDMCLSFALYRLLRCRFDDLSLPSDSVVNTRRLISKIIGKGNADFATQISNYSEKTFRIVRSELAFLNDYFYTRYPVLFWRGFPIFASCHPVLTIAFTVWLGKDLHKIYKPKQGGANVDIIITWGFMFIIVFKELWKMIIYLLSDWTKVMVLCEYTADSFKHAPRWLCKGFLWLLCTRRSKIVHHWHNKVNQYEFLQSFNYRPCKWNILYYGTLGLFARRRDGEKPGKSIELPEDVKSAILRSLCSQNLERDSLEPNFPILFSTFGLPCSHIILVWHIATTLCEIELSQRYNGCLTDSELQHAVKAGKNSQPYVVKEERLEGALQANYIVASCISRYCAYLLVSEPDLLPDTYLSSAEVFESTVKEASDVLKGSDNLQSIYRKLMYHGDVVNVDNMNRRHPSVILARSAQVAKSLVETEVMDRWEMLAGVWAEMLVHIAPSWNAAAHKKCLSTGGEFVTQIWAILSHCNIQESNLWPQQESPNDNEAEQQEESVSGNQASFSAQQRAAAGHGGVRDDEAGPSGTKPNDETKDDDEKKMSVNLSSRTPIKRDSVS
ncbi:uncharacterized protein [Oryza sativa Japonica Group]|uniref:Os10g0450400 protein n=2 Tax=Oryza sativa subsp. japonica TaxID=39947 RepID=A0A8J8Y194_ORYSJ|nr:uncharacterized protein LOC4348765 [Oryza sativa Japonica Group]XP_015613374.1 uncharacterized protein LOC4348765 [Oryza sativa Japonica Group]XP_025876390.1 uncharacterized protein LOC4348765 [Oryza sativa Japonica Group]AAP54036.2 expressed protein [Oryza sativa Japonica Group]EEE51063.1 hypothetical protein OsJ_31728 [Oryza sativa Japonica Group]KAF2913847.1 hypothetical protein DAI22_10g117400 [Oryza sativa Japonica Group]BAF26641.1 Os10g0450400 [Oryza sativa Japonica Group]BAG99620.1|eukprot:NP_001064727.1 Os10g0450400 [Oryza sativa Japonica Group]